jgi:hypothetical protein
LSGSRAGEDFVNPPVSSYLGAYGLWLVTFFVGLLVAYFVRDVYQMAMVFTTFDRYAVHLFGQFSVVILVLLLLILLVSTEAYYRHGVPRHQVGARFARVMAILALVLAAAQGFRLVLEVLAGAVNLISVLIFAAALLVYALARSAAAPALRKVKRGTAAGAPATPAPPPAASAARQRLWWQIAGAVILLSGLVLIALPIKYPINVYDEGLALVGGMRVLHGDVPLRDFWAIYPPGQAYTLGALFGLFGENVMVERVYDTLVRMGLALVLYLVAARLLRSWRWALVPYLTAAVLLAAATFYGYAVYPALLGSFGALLLAFRGAETRRRAWLLGAGVLLGVTAWFRHDLGFYAAAATGLLLLLARLLPAEGEISGKARVRGVAGDLLAALGPAALLVVLFYGYLGSVAGFDVMVQNLVVFPATTFRAVRQLLYPALLPDFSIWGGEGSFDSRLDRMWSDYLRFYIPLVVYAITALLLVWRGVRAVRGSAPFAHTDSLAAALLVLGAGLFMQALSRYDEIHVLPASLAVLLLLTWLVRQIPGNAWRRPLVATPVVALLLVPFVLYFVGPYFELSDNVRNYAPGGCYSTLPRAGCVATVPGQDDVVQILEHQSPEGGPLFAGQLRHDNVFANDVSIYFLAGRPIATRYHELHPGVTTTEPVQAEMVAELQAQAPEWLVFITWGNPNEPNASRFSSGVTLLDDYIREHYSREHTVGMYEMWRQRP